MLLLCRDEQDATRIATMPWQESDVLARVEQLASPEEIIPRGALGVRATATYSEGLCVWYSVAEVDIILSGLYLEAPGSQRRRQYYERRQSADDWCKAEGRVRSDPVEALERGSGPQVLSGRRVHGVERSRRPDHHLENGIRRSGASSGMCNGSILIACMFCGVVVTLCPPHLRSLYADPKGAPQLPVRAWSC